MKYLAFILLLFACNSKPKEIRHLNYSDSIVERRKTYPPPASKGPYPRVLYNQCTGEYAVLTGYDTYNILDTSGRFWGLNNPRSSFNINDGNIDWWAANHNDTSIQSRINNAFRFDRRSQADSEYKKWEDTISSREIRRKAGIERIRIQDSCKNTFK